MAVGQSYPNPPPLTHARAPAHRHTHTPHPSGPRRHGTAPSPCCPRWVVHTAFARPNEVQVQLAELTDGTAFLCFARTVSGPALHHGEPRPTHIVAMGCSIDAAPLVVHADGLDIARNRVGIGLSYRLCDRPNCRSRAFPPLEHRLALDPMLTGVSPWRFEKRG